MNPPNDNEDPKTKADESITEADATHYLLRHQYAQETVRCLTCNMEFESKTMSDIYEHYYYYVHKIGSGVCLYCGGKVYEYKLKNKVKKFHNCSRSRRDLE